MDGRKSRREERRGREAREGEGRGEEEEVGGGEEGMWGCVCVRCNEGEEELDSQGFLRCFCLIITGGGGDRRQAIREEWERKREGKDGKEEVELEE